MENNENIDKTENNYKWIDNFKDVMNNYQYFIFDCDGIIWQQDLYFSKVAKLLNDLKNSGKMLFFLTNSNARSRLDIQQKLLTAGFESDFEFIYNAGYITAKSIKYNYPGIKHIYIIGTKGLTSEFEKLGFKVYDSSDDINLHTEFEQLNLDEFTFNKDIQAVCCGYDPSINYYKILYALQILKNGCKLFGTNIDKFDKYKNIYIPGSFTVIASLEACGETKAQIYSKPSKLSFDLIMKDHNIPESEKDKCIMIGDNMNTDIMFGNNCMIDTCLVFSGVTKLENYLKLTKEELGKLGKPKYLLKNFDKYE